MDENKAFEMAADDGFELAERISQGRWVWGWAPGDDERWPCYLTRGEAVRWMADYSRRGHIFAWTLCRPGLARASSVKRSSGHERCRAGASTAWARTQVAARCVIGRMS
jgi:hypothetical protein